MRYLSRSRETGNKKREPRNEKQWRWAEQLRLSPPGNSIVRRRAGHAVSRSRADCGVGPARTCSRQTARTCGSRKCASALDVGTEYTSLRDGISVITAINAVLKSRLHCFCPRHLSLACRVSSHETALAHCPPPSSPLVRQPASGSGLTASPLRVSRQAALTLLTLKLEWPYRAYHLRHAHAPITTPCITVHAPFHLPPAPMESRCLRHLPVSACALP